MVQQTEFMGVPFSQGSAGEGIRILLGSDVLPYQASMPPDKNNFTNAPQQDNVDKSTRWLIPGSPAAFDPRCKPNDIDAAYNANCSLVGTFQSCTTGCNLDDRQEQIWANLPQTILGIPLKSGRWRRGKYGMIYGECFPDIPNSKT